MKEMKDKRKKNKNEVREKKIDVFL